MMTGVVNADLEPLLRLTVRDAGSRPHDVEVVIDTGFNGFLTLPPTLIAALGLPWLCRHQGNSQTVASWRLTFTWPRWIGTASRGAWKSKPPTRSRSSEWPCCKAGSCESRLSPVVR
jgi:hypothetical protein